MPSPTLEQLAAEIEDIKKRLQALEAAPGKPKPVQESGPGDPDC